MTTPSRAIARTPYVSNASDHSEKKYPVTKEQIAYALGHNIKCVHLTERDMLDILHNSVKKLVRKLAIKYQGTSRLEVKDLDQSCWVRICAKLHTYKSPDKGGSKFTTWCWRVCKSVLDRIYRKGEREHELLVDTEEPLDENRVGDEDARKEALRMDFRKAVEDLRVEHPNKERIINAMFKDADGDFNQKIVFCDIAKRSGVPSSKVSKFYKEIVQPFFINRFEGVMA